MKHRSRYDITYVFVKSNLTGGYDMEELSDTEVEGMLEDMYQEQLKNAEVVANG